MNGKAEQLVENIRTICREKDISIMQMENDLGFSAGLISRWNKTKTCPSFDKVIDIMEYLNISFEELMRNTKFFNGGKQKSPASDNSVDNDAVIQLEKESISGNIKWEKGRENVPFKMEVDMIFPNMLDYDMHRIYYTTYKKGWFLLSVQYSEETADMLAAVFILTGSGMNMEKLNAAEERVMRLMRAIDEEAFERINHAQVDKMKEDFLREDFRNRYRSVS